MSYSLNPTLDLSQYHTTTIFIMSYFEEVPSVFFRVQDKYSQAQHREHSGILSRNQSNASFDPYSGETRQAIQDHLDWANRMPSAFISVYSDWTTAYRDARRRVDNGYQDVVIWKIDTREGHEMAQYRNIRRLASTCRIWVPQKAWHNSEHEWLFLHRVPDSMVVGYWAIKRYSTLDFQLTTFKVLHSSLALPNRSLDKASSVVAFMGPTHGLAGRLFDKVCVKLQ